MINNTFTYEQLKEAVEACTGYTLTQHFDDEHDEYILLDPYGDQDGDPFHDLDDVYDFITNNDQVNTYLQTEFN